ncbi:alpha-2-macroglobulin family protein [Ostreiculturibacter nitratireducens]|uniref:alpha-2-macroglobulin family protein n=1 Tax=Ostreiculturibacter nitratireducens TaxID=3075226 RepID=UPI0031B5F9D5
MRLLTRTLILVGSLATVPAFAQDTPLVPERRMVLTENLDFYGSDLSSIFDTTLEACEAACLSDDRCQAFTFNARSNSCFPKSRVSEQQPYDGAISGWVRNAAPGAEARAELRAEELDFLEPQDFARAYEQAKGLANLHITGSWTAADLLAAVDRERGAGNFLAASKFQGAALNLTDAADQWVEYARLLLAIRGGSGNTLRGYRERALSASVNGYLRADRAALRANALGVMAEALEANGRGRDMIPALRLAQATQPRDDAAAALEDAIGKYGFRIAEHRVESDSANPRICAVFNEELVRAGQDYTPFVQLPEPGLSVEASADTLCVAGVTHGKRYTLTFREGLPAASGEELAKDTQLNIYVRDRAPSVRFPGRAYVLPRTDGAGIPVETVNLTEVELMLMRISDRNLVRALQSDYFARSLDYWQAEYFNAEVAEEVWRGTGEVTMEVNRDMTTRLPLDEVIGGLPAGIYALQASAKGQNLYDRPAATQWFVISDLGMTTMSGTDGLHVFVRSLADATPKAGVKATLVSRSNAVLGTVETDAEGYAHFPAGLTSGRGGASPALVTVEDGAEDIAFVALTEPEFDLSDRGVAGREAAPPIDVFLTTDRGAYRAGEVIHATALARDAKAEAIEGMPLSLRLMRPDGVEFTRALSDGTAAGGHVFDLPLAGTAPRGTWRLEAFVDPDAPALASTDVLVEDFLPERIDFDLSLPDGALRLGTSPELTVTARYLFGAPGAGLQVEGDLRLSAATGIEGFEGYSFGRHDEPFDTYGDSFFGEPTDSDGRTSLFLPLPGDRGEARPLTARINVRVAEGSGRPVERRIERTIMPATPVIGIDPLFEDVAAEGAEARFRVLALGPDMAPAGMEVRWTLNRLEHRYQWYSLYGSWNWEVTTSRTRVAEGDVMLTPSGAVEIAAPVDWGNYELVVESTGGAYAASSVEFYAGWYAPADAAATPDTLELSLDKPAYLPGETATLRLVPRAAGVALVTVVSNRLIDMKAIAVTEGENVVALPVTDDWGAGAYVTASVIRPLNVEAGRAPARALGLSYAAVDPGKRRLSADFEVAAEADPRGTLPVALKVEGVEPGETAYATIAAVDVGILNLTAFTSPDPEGHYFGQRKLGIGIRDIYGRLIDGRTGAEGRVRSGGDAGAGMRMQAPPPTEELVAYFSGPIEVGADGYARTEFRLPSFNGTVRLMAVAWSKTGIGQSEAEVLVRDPVVVAATVPRFMAPGDDSRMLLEIVHATGPSGRMGLDVSSADFALPEAMQTGVDLAEKGKAVLTLPIRAPEAEGIGQIRVALTTPDGRQLVKDLTIPVQVNDPPVSRTSRFTLASGQTFTLDDNVFDGIIPGTGRVTLAVGPIARFDAPGLLASLDAYPYGCTEQITSKALPLLYFEEVARVMGLDRETDIRTRIDQSISRVLLNQASNGAFGLWYAEAGDFWLDAYVTDFLSRARAQGFEVPDVAFRNALDNLRNQVNYAPDFDKGGGELAYALMVLAREGAAAVGDLRYYADVKGDAFDTPIAAAQLGAALGSYGDQTRADAMFARAARLMSALPTGDDAQIWRSDYGTNLRDRAAVLALAAEAGSAVVSPEALGESVAASMAGRRMSTQEATWALLATHALIDRPGAEGFTVNGQPVDGPLVRVLDDETAGAALAVANGSAREATLTLTTLGVPEVAEPAGGKGYTITRSYYDMEGVPVDPARVAQGARLVTVLEITPHAEGEARLIVDDPLPAGFEIDNPNLIRGGDIAALDWLDTVEFTRMSEFRQERFLAAVDWRSDDPFRLAYIVRAVSPGTFRHPAASVEDMYRPDFRAWTATGRVAVAE